MNSDLKFQKIDSGIKNKIENFDQKSDSKVVIDDYIQEKLSQNQKTRP